MTMIYCCITVMIIDKQCVINYLLHYGFQLHLDIVKIKHLGHMGYRLVQMYTGRRKSMQPTIKSFLSSAAWHD